MKQTHALLLDGILARLSNRASVPTQMITIELNHALEELHARIRMQRAEWLTRTRYFNVVSNQDVYDLPEDCPQGNLQMVEVKVSESWVKCDRRTLQHMDRVAEIQDCPYNYVVVGSNQIRLFMPYVEPTTTVVNGLRITYMAGIQPLVNLEDVPNVPPELHEWLEVGTIDRLRQMPDVAVAKPDEFEQFRRGWEQRLMAQLAPMHIDQPPLIGDEDEFYMGHM